MPLKYKETYIVIFELMENLETSFDRILHRRYFRLTRNVAYQVWANKIWAPKRKTVKMTS